MSSEIQQDVFELTFLRNNFNNKRTKTSTNLSSRPSSFRIEKINQQNDPWQKMKKMKAQAKQTEQQYLQLLSSVKQSQKQISQNYKQVQRKKVSFLKLYETKKLKNLSNNLQKQCKTQRQQKHSQIKQQVKRQKVEQQLSRLITKQQKQSQISKLRQELQRQKNKFRGKKYLKQKELFARSRNSFLSIRRAQDESRERRNQIKSASDVRSKQIYWKKMGEEIKLLGQYEKMINDMEKYEQIQTERKRSIQTSQTARTTRTTNGFFITDKK